MLPGDLCRTVGMYWVEVDIFDRWSAPRNRPYGPCIWISQGDIVTSAGVVSCAWIMKPDGSVTRIPQESLGKFP